ncbi:hypothetical protein QCA50_004604 [Cerrena zonata]|uniref:Protein kinase domain-containing protein n=1 Tax=Cerrena zonata TaxID=2478898 RepID=A0AAW0GI18_9APHY
MLQYTVQLPPLSLSSSKHKSKSASKSSHPSRDSSDDPSRSSTSTLPSNASSTNPLVANSSHFNSKRGLNTHDKLAPARQATYPAFSPSSSSHPHALAISTSIASLPSISSGSASPSLSSARPPTLRSPLLSSSRALPSPIISASRPLSSASPVPTHRQLPSVTGGPTRSPHPLKANLPSLNGSRPGTGTSISRPSTGTASRPNTAPGLDTSGYFSTTQSRSSSLSSTLADVLSPGELVGEGLPLQDDIVNKVPIPAPHFDSASEEPATEFEVVRKLGTGSYAVVYLVREVLSRAMVAGSPSSSVDGHVSAVGRMDMDSDDGYGYIVREKEERVYGREYAVKVLSKANLDEDALDAQLFEATLHQSLRPHANIVTLYRTLETRAFLLLLLEFVPGEDLFYFLEQSRDHYSPESPVSPTLMSPTASSPGTPASPTSPSSPPSSSHTPPTPSLLSSLHPSHLLSHTRLRLIASMFSQMCDAVAACHEQKVFHRDIKPENFIVTDAWVDKLSLKDGEKIVKRERKVVVKLTDFGLGTMDEESADMDCGSAPYMSFECRNNIHPTYSPRAADVWSLGIVLINMLYHYNPWSDTTQGVCPSFELYLRDPITFFMSRFTGMTLPVAEFLTRNVFCILEDPQDDSSRVSAREFGRWARELPSLFNGVAPGTGHRRNMSISSTVGYALASVPQSRRPSLRHAPYSGDRSSWALGGNSRVPSQRASWALSRQPSFVAVDGSSLPAPMEETSMEMLNVNAMLDHSVLEQDEPAEQDGFEINEAEIEVEETTSRSASTQKRRKRGARKGKNANNNADDTLTVLAEASQALAREISKTSKSPAGPLLDAHLLHHHQHALPSHIAPSSMSALSMSMSSNSPAHSVSVLPQVSSQTSTTSVLPPSLTSNSHSTSVLQLSASGKSSSSRRPSLLNISASSASSAHAPSPTTPTTASISKKSSKWKLSFGKNSHGSSNNNPPPVPAVQSDGMGTTVSNVTTLLMGLNAPPPSTTSHQPKRSQAPASHSTSNLTKSSNNSQVSLEDTQNWPRGRKAGKGTNVWGPASSQSAFGATGPYQQAQQNASTASWNSSTMPPPPPPSSNAGHSQAPSFVSERDRRAVSPSSTRSGRPLASSASSMASSNWRSSMSSSGASSSSSAFTKYSNGSTRSVSTAATSVSSSSWRSGSSKYPYETGQLPPNVKLMTGTPWELDQLPRQMYINPDEARFGAPPPAKRRANKKDPSASASKSKLGTIDEWPNQKSPGVPATHSQPSSPLSQRHDAATSTTDLGQAELDVDGSSPRKVQKGQINALAKMLSALRR